MTANELHRGEEWGEGGMLVSGKQQRVRAKISLHQSFPIPGVRPINVGRPPALAREKPNRVLFGRALLSARNRGRNRERRQGGGGIDILSVSQFPYLTQESEINSRRTDPFVDRLVS